MESNVVESLYLSLQDGQLRVRRSEIAAVQFSDGDALLYLNNGATFSVNSKEDMRDLRNTLNRRTVNTYAAK